MTKSNPGPLSPIPLVPLLITESEEEYHRIRQGFYDEIGPVGIIEKMYVDELVDIVWEILRLKRCRAGVTNLNFHDSSHRILFKLIQAGPDVARDWISDPKAAEAVEGELATYKLDGSVIIADAIRKASFDLQAIELLLASLEKRRDVVLHRIYDFRRDLSSVLRRTTDRLIESAVAENAVVENAVTESAVTESAVTESAVTESAVTESAVTESAVTESAVTESAVTESAVTESAVTESAVTESAVTESAVTESAVTESAVTESAVTESAVTKSAVTKSAVTKSAAAENPVFDSEVAAISRPVAKKKSRRRFRSDGTIIRLASAAANAANDAENAGAGATDDSGGGSVPARRGTAA